MKDIDITKINTYNKFITRGLKKAILVKYIPEAGIRHRLVFLVDGNILTTDEKGICWYVNNYDSSYLDTSFRNYDIFVDDIQEGWINIVVEGNIDIHDENIIAKVVSNIFNTYENAKKDIDNKQLWIDEKIKTVKLQWSIEDE